MRIDGAPTEGPAIATGHDSRRVRTVFERIDRLELPAADVKDPAIDGDVTHCECKPGTEYVRPGRGRDERGRMRTLREFRDDQEAAGTHGVDWKSVSQRDSSCAHAVTYRGNDA
jgi:hypothetical protein